MSITDCHLWSMQVMLCAKSLQRTIEATPKNHTTIFSIGNSSNPSRKALSIPTLQQMFMPQFFLYSLQFLLHIPKPNTAISWATGKLVRVNWVKFAIMDSICVSFGIVEFFDIHVAFDSQKWSGSVFVQKSYLFASVYYHQVCACWVEA